MPVQRETILRPTYFDLRWMAKGRKTCIHLHANLSSIKVNASHHKLLQVHTSHGQTESQVNASFQFAITCVSVWLGFKLIFNDTNPAGSSNPV